MTDLLQAIVKLADKPIQYVIADDAVYFSLKQPEIVPYRDSLIMSPYELA
jgi:hypothetical protein